MSIVRYAGLGSRRTPPQILALMRKAARRLAARECTLHGGSGFGAESAFSLSAGDDGGSCVLWLPHDGYNKRRLADGAVLLPSAEHEEVARSINKGWDQMDALGQRLAACGAAQVLGPDCRHEVSFVLCWTADGCETELGRSDATGATGTAIALAEIMRIPVFNLARTDALERLAAHVNRHVAQPVTP